MNADVLKALSLPEDADDATVLDAICELKTAEDATAGLDRNDLDRFGALAFAGIRAEQRIRKIAAEDNVGSRRSAGAVRCSGCRGGADLFTQAKSSGGNAARSALADRR
jgi:hypothetical protein